jgi:replicative DNA helicase
LYPNNLNTNRSRNEIVTDISKELFELAGKLNIVMITASQLSRASSKDADQASLVKPKMSDLKDS